MKKLLLLAIALVFCSCSGPSKVAPSVSKFSVFGISSGWKLNIPVPEAYTFTITDWKFRQDAFSLEEKLMAFTFVKGNEEVSLRGEKRIFSTRIPPSPSKKMLAMRSS
ncbi:MULTISPECIES: hypothetical protein [unclassified Fibrobacter]|uniref:hypothetical protein n=1 Tax=unclassified Fibrobacter TaxID=2634177 RepID=UPI000D6B44B3|nr:MULTISPECIES: hypothetical protein [unclassified Fibrobacter]PWJ63742.1 hypothetical protein BGX12_11761 [Fibrobacter sp. UWR4]PZW69130.1 hypothetical protein C8E88_101662 [Fibrobacter sp. UWR1]